ncbi:MAG: DUF4340 domain-containing protein [Bacteroidales bacterium]
MRSFNFLAVLTVVLLAITAGVFWYSNTWSTLRPGDSDFSLDRSREVMRITLHSELKGEKVVIQRDDAGRWQLNNHYFANESAVEQLLSAMARLRVRQPVSRENHQQVMAALDQEGVEVEVFVRAWRIHLGQLKLIPYAQRYQSIRVGEDTADNQSTYMRKSRSDRAFKVHIPGVEGGVATIFDARERSWRNPVVTDLQPDQIASISIIVPQQPQQSFTLRNYGRNGFGFYHVQTPQPLESLQVDTLRVVRFLSAFADLHYETLLDESQEEIRKNTIFEQPFMEIHVESTSGILITLEAFARKPSADDLQITPGIASDPNRFYVRVNGQEFALAQYFVFNRVLRPLSFFKN